MNHRSTGRRPASDTSARNGKRPRRGVYVLSLLGRELLGVFQRLCLWADRVYRGTLRVLLFLAKSVRFVFGMVRRVWRAIRSFVPRAWRFLGSLATRTGDALGWLARSLASAWRGVRGFFVTWVAKCRDLWRRLRTKRPRKARREAAKGQADGLSLLTAPSAERASKRARRLGSFLVKEMLDILQQPRLVVTLILGPFLISVSPESKAPRRRSSSFLRTRSFLWTSRSS